MAVKKLWKKPKIIQMDIGRCKFCSANMVNTESFVVFASSDENGKREKAHNKCYNQDYYKQLINKQKEKHAK